jgi:hypothetical protein
MTKSKSKRIDQIARAAGARTQAEKKQTTKRAMDTTIREVQRAYDRSRVKELPNNLKPHPLAEAFPPLTKDEFAGLVEDIRVHGQQIPIVVLDGKILDGVHRYKACRKLGIKARGEHYSGKDAAAFVCSANVHRTTPEADQQAEARADRKAAEGQPGDIRSAGCERHQDPSRDGCG